MQIKQNIHFWCARCGAALHAQQDDLATTVIKVEPCACRARDAAVTAETHEFFADCRRRSLRMAMEAHNG